MKSLFSISAHGIGQVLMVVLQVLNLVLPVVPTQYKVYVTLGIGVVQILLHQYGFNQTPPSQKATPAG